MDLKIVPHAKTAVFWGHVLVTCPQNTNVTKKVEKLHQPVLFMTAVDSLTNFLTG